MRDYKQMLADTREQMKRRPELYEYKGNPVGPGFQYLGLALAGEAGEVADVVKKMLRDGWTEKRADDLIEELGDVLWYFTAWCELLGLTIDDIADANQRKLLKRRAEGGKLG